MPRAAPREKVSARALSVSAMAKTVSAIATRPATPSRTGARRNCPRSCTSELGAPLALGRTMLTRALALPLNALCGAADPAVVSPSCDIRLNDLRDAQRSLEGLHRSEQHLRRRFTRAHTRDERRKIERVLVPISNQARALEEEVDAQERAYIRCVEAQLDARASQVAKRLSGTTCQGPHDG